ncbi:MAG: hypothetical protein WAS54_05975 [Scrofimicrobium sp.]
MKYGRLLAWLVLVALSSAVARLLLWAINPNDPEGTNLLVTAFATATVFTPLALAYVLISRRRRAKHQR